MNLNKRGGSQKVNEKVLNDYVEEYKNEIKEEIETMTAAKQMEKRIMTMMPYFILFYVRTANPGYFDILYKSFAGMIVVTISLICLWIADSWAERVIEIEV